MDKNLLDLLSVLDTCLDEAEGGTHCAFYTLIIHIDSLEKIYELKPKLVTELVCMHRFLRGEDWTISSCAMAFEFNDTITFMEKHLGMEEHRDYFVLYGTTLDYCAEYGIKEEEIGEKYTELFPKTFKYFDFVRVLRVFRFSNNSCLRKHPLRLKFPITPPRVWQGHSSYLERPLGLYGRSQRNRRLLRR